jgi:hypothetical protein
MLFAFFVSRLYVFIVKHGKISFFPPRYEEIFRDNFCILHCINITTVFLTALHASIMVSTSDYHGTDHGFHTPI